MPTILKDLYKRQRQERLHNAPRDPNNILDVMENSSSRHVQHQKRTYSIGGVPLSSPSQVEQFCKDHGMNPNNLTIKPEIIPDAGGKATIHVNVEMKE